MKKVHVALFAASLLVLAGAGAAQADDHAAAVAEEAAAPVAVGELAPATEGVAVTEEAAPTDGTAVLVDDDKGAAVEDGAADEVTQLPNKQGFTTRWEGAAPAGRPFLVAGFPEVAPKELPDSGVSCKRETMTDADAPSDDDLLAKARQGDAWAFGVWIERQYDFIYRISYKLLRHQMDAEDLTQDVCIKLADRIGSYSGQGSARGWLARVVLNAGHDRLRHKKRRATSPLDGVAEPPAVEAADDKTYLNEVMNAMSRLPEKSRHALLLAAEGLSHAEMAEVLECAAGTVGWRISTARDELSRLLTGGQHASA